MLKKWFGIGGSQNYYDKLKKKNKKNKKKEDGIIINHILEYINRYIFKIT